MSPAPVFNYDLQVWVQGGVVLRCKHPEWMRRDPVTNGYVGPCCRAFKWAGLREADAIFAHEQELLVVRKLQEQVR